ncbi:MAG TPA: helix-turn-helix transcriptional regulator [Gemmatimonadales bacterium]|nr:helix-turn-helix transcriptional regulator [Gemmatimonadales bacterium]
MDLAFVVSRRLEELGLDQRDLARAARVTESYISQLLTRKKAPPAPNRTDIYGKMDRALKLPPGELAKVADLQRKDRLKEQLGDQPKPFFEEVRALILQKCHPDRRQPIRAIFERQPFGELERLVTQALLDVVKDVVRDELENERWLRTVARLSRRSYEEMRVSVLEFLDTDVFQVSVENSVTFLDPLIQSWDMDLGAFDLDIVLNRKMVANHERRFEFTEIRAAQPLADGPGLKAFLQDRMLSGSATDEEIEFLRSLKFNGKQPTPIYYYRELQNLRDPLHFRTP